MNAYTIQYYTSFATELILFIVSIIALKRVPLFLKFICLDGIIAFLTDVADLLFFSYYNKDNILIYDIFDIAEATFLFFFFFLGTKNKSIRIQSVIYIILIWISNSLFLATEAIPLTRLMFLSKIIPSFAFTILSFCKIHEEIMDRDPKPKQMKNTIVYICFILIINYAGHFINWAAGEYWIIHNESAKENLYWIFCCINILINISLTYTLIYYLKAQKTNRQSWIS